ncbi:MAG: glycosyltransferase, partial [Bifidobacteriaceae bacterium]|jgi:glycosyltransferase involved in cell wall biosynthesis|nr:glycosyltransferase [Bifidobacteriaceae bacterium]
VAGADNAALGQALAAADGLADRVVLAGRQPPARAWRWAEGAWAGLLLLDDTPAFRQAMPSKLYEYLACGLPVVTTALARPAALIRQTGAGAVVGDGAEAGAVLREWSENPSAYDEVAAKARSARQRWLAGGDPMGRFARAVARLSNR